MTLSDRSAALQTLLCLLLMTATVFVESRTDLDMFVQRHWYDVVQGLWLIDARQHETWRWLFYDGMKTGVAVVGVLSVMLFIAGWVRRRKVWMRVGLLMAFSCAATPLLVSVLKAVTGIYCPKQLEVFGGTAPYRHILMIFSSSSGGRCFPGGHASGGFALTILFFCCSGRRAGFSALFITAGIGWIMGLYQMMRGEHFLSHTVVSMLLAWQMNLLLVLLVDRVLLPVLEKRRAC